MYVELKDINKHFNNYKASDHVSFGIEKGKLIGLLGPRLLAGTSLTTLPSMIISPLSGCSNPAIIRRMVVFPDTSEERQTPYRCT